MTWITYTILMFFFSILFYLAVRQGKKLELSASTLTLATFCVPVILVASYIWFNRIEVDITLKQLFIVILSGFFFSYLGNIFSMRSIKLAPNPGFSLMIQKSYGAFTLFAAPLLFSSEITTKGIIGTFLVIAFGLLLSIEKGKKLITKDNSWILFALLAFFCFGFLSLSAKYLFGDGLNVYVYMLIMYIFIIGFALIKPVLSKDRFLPRKNEISTFVLIGIFAFGFSLTKNLAFDVAPNIGYVNAANAGSIAALTVISAIVFKDRLNLQKMIGVVGIFIGLLMIFI